MRVNGINYEIDWTKFKKGRSFFVPCLDAEEAKASVARIMDRLGFEVKVKLVIENGFRGLRVWRVG
jgi:hypothetical protein